jgi:thiamine-phosphate pyrophosphorylase
MRLVLPRLYVILDAALLKQSEKVCAENLAAAGVRLLQFRDKRASPRELLRKSRGLAELLSPQGVTFFVNDRADVASLAGASGVHVGQEDLAVEQARVVIGEAKLVGVSTHNREQFARAAKTAADYIAVGPIFATQTKENPDPVVGLELLRQVRRSTDKPIVAIGGITLERAAEVIAAGADSVSVISDILQAPEPAARAAQYLELLGNPPPAIASREPDVLRS